MTIAKVTSKGQVTIPKEVRKKLGIRAPGKMVWYEEAGKLYIEPLDDLDALQGKFKKDFRGRTLAEVRRDMDRGEARDEAKRAPRAATRRSRRR